MISHKTSYFFGFIIAFFMPDTVVQINLFGHMIDPVGFALVFFSKLLMGGAGAFGVWIFNRFIENRKKEKPS